jgi:tetratricopeptide (TPR) repeat protein
MRRVRRAWLALGLLPALVLLPGCGGGGDSGPSDSASSLTAEGWALFESGEYGLSVDKFERALALDPSYADAYNGLGWCYAGLDSLSRSLDYFGRAITEASQSVVLADSYAGSSPVYRDLDTRPSHFDSAAVYASSALSLDKRYVFDHDHGFDWHDLHLIMAQSYFALSNYASAKARVDSLGGNVLDPGSPSFIEDLAEEIERLESVYGN